MLLFDFYQLFPSLFFDQSFIINNIDWFINNLQIEIYIFISWLLTHYKSNSSIVVEENWIKFAENIIHIYKQFWNISSLKKFEKERNIFIMGFEAWEKREILKFHILSHQFCHSFYWKRMLYYITLLFSVIFLNFTCVTFLNLFITGYVASTFIHRLYWN